MAETVLMHGPAFDGSGNIVERQVHVPDVPAYVAAGYVKGAFESKIAELAVEVPITYTLEDAIAQNDGVDITKKGKRK
jgi:hypothetical protein